MDSTEQSWSGLISETQVQDHQLLQQPQQQPQGQGQTQAQQNPQRQTNQLRKKLRESCNNCAISKVKCSKDQPICVRCDDRGIFCHYSPSRRTGKRRRAWSSESTGATINHVSRGSISPLEEVPTFDFQQELGSYDFHSDLGRKSPTKITSAPNLKLPISDVQMPRIFDDAFMPWDERLFAVNIDSGKFDTPMTDYSTSSYTDIDMMAHASDSTVSPSSFDSLLRVLTAEPTPPPTESATPTPQSRTCSFVSGDITSPAHTPQDCMSLALNTLQSLHMAPNTCTSLSALSTDSPVSPQTPTIDHVLATNKAIIESVGIILDCSCSLDTQLCLILTLIASKIISWYSAIARNDEGDASSNGSSLKASAERVLYLPITVGKYHLDGADKGKMRAQLVLSELHRVVRLVEQLAKRFNEAGQGSRCEAGMMDAKRLKDDIVASSIGSELEAFLRNRVRAVTKETMDILRDR
ncbi:hypothetical protein B7494_g7014 [Chlorociboria aeruginascens]|nr:hypothetical protein B7494_g7014 [Chlorociboria aeruginascens]